MISTRIAQAAAVASLSLTAIVLVAGSACATPRTATVTQASDSLGWGAPSADSLGWGAPAADSLGWG
ncbi:hypothetical protein ACIQWR_13685 [Streptomyces sp. NPDC098789]|uniref:hypothetical protein n=1 Tax=Streptomyces sp. NPDC098789 TaxID=3366098 RepID=UPI00382EAD3C